MNQPAPAPVWSLRTEIAEDGDHLGRVYCSTREHEEPICRWPAVHRDRFLLLQQQAQDRDYRRRYPDAARWVIVVGNSDAGRLILNRTAEDERIVDIALLTRFRGRGIGAAVVRWVIEQAAVRGASVSLSVLMDSPAKHLYTRLGFREQGFGTPPYIEMRRPAAAPRSS